MFTLQIMHFLALARWILKGPIGKMWIPVTKIDKILKQMAYNVVIFVRHEFWEIQQGIYPVRRKTL